MNKPMLTPENQIQRLNQLLHFVESLKKVEPHLLIKQPNKKTWNILEVLEHLSISYSFYQNKIEKSLNEANESDESVWKCSPNFWNRFIIEGQRPKGTKRPYKIKTLKKFKPLLEEGQVENSVDAVFERFFSSYQELKQYIVISRTKNLSKIRISSAIGSIVMFRLPEAFEFLICHAERHRVQIEEILTNQTG